MTQDYPEAVYVGRYSNSWQIRRNKDDLDYDILVEEPVAYLREDITQQRENEAEARGAAEQRRKDAEGQEPIAYLIRDKRRPVPHRWVTCSAEAFEEYRNHKTVETCAVYTRPANVAALEKDAMRYRIVRQRFLEDARNQGETLTLAQFDEKVDGDTQARAALTREGGV